MKKIVMQGIFATFIVLLCGCDDEQVKISTHTKDKSHLIEQAENRDKSSYAGLEDVFLDTKHLYTQDADNKLTLFIFAKNNCLYCDKLKDDIANDNALKSMLQAHFLPDYINTSYTKKHILHKGEDTQTIPTFNLMEFYVKSPMRPTPTLVFVDREGKSIYELPGYLPKDQMLKLYTYMANGAWKGKDEKQIIMDINKEL
ncbi:MAG: thioredoxin fold domain-containing protein [Helicobacter sp.]|uniref:thioredoxin fold domain-containing protein n=1 Tax=Helicobacter sp. TaxID=218 RepID=UPI0025C68BBC|nr:thioredoxin fold domain-containing protein [Helicobacter sp.]MCH5313350.1 thioredoxin fold domain-containing protein [Helicobacter sp.]